MSKNFIGIDFGTTKTLVAYCHEGDEKPEIARLGRSTDKIPTTVFIDEFGESFIGEDADDNMEIDPRRHAMNFKLDLGRQNSGIRCKVNDAPKSYSAKILCGEFLKKVHERIRDEVFQGDEVAHVVATIPANFSPAQKEELLQAVHEAGFPSVDLLTEPEAAGLAYTKLESTDKFSKCLIVDWGGGTLDLALLTRNSSGELNVAEGHADGRNDIGGIRLDDALFEFLDEKSNGQISSEDDTVILNLQRRVRVEKEMISKVNHRNIRLPLSSGSWTYPLEREEFNRIIEPLVQKAVSLVQTFLGDIPANLKPEALLLVGGSSSIPYIRETLEKETGIKSYTWQYANEAVALGAAYKAKTLFDESESSPSTANIETTSSRHILGIDLGTTNTRIAFMDGGKPTIIMNEKGRGETPTVVALSKSGEWLVGDAAKEQALLNPVNTIYGIPRFLGRKYNEVASLCKGLPFQVAPDANGNAAFQIDGNLYLPQSLCALVLDQVKRDAESYLGERVSEVILTVPVYFNDIQRNAVEEAARFADLKCVRMISDVTAVALSYGVDRKEEETIAVMDVGGGAVSLEIMDIEDGVFEVKTVWGDLQLGGLDIDTDIMHFLCNRFEKSTGIDLWKDPIALQRIRDAAEKAKCELSTAQATDVNIPFISADATGPQHLQETLSRADLERIIKNEFDQRLATGIRDCLRDADLSHVDEVVFVGGCSRIPLFEKIVSDGFRCKTKRNLCPEAMAAWGAAIQGGVCTGAIKDVVLLDVIPLTYGIETLGGVCTPIIERNTTLPAAKSEVFSSAVENQPSVEIRLYQGNSKKVCNNTFLGNYLLNGIPPAGKGVPRIQVTVDIDAKGILNVSAKDLGTEKQHTVSLKGERELEPDSPPKYPLQLFSEEEHVVSQTLAHVEQMFFEFRIPEITKNEADIIARAVRDGHPRAMALLGDIYMNGCDGYLVNEEQSVKYWTAAADAGDDLGQTRLALYYIGSNTSTVSEKSKALALAQKAVETARSIHNLATLVMVLSVIHTDEKRKPPAIRKIAEEIMALVGTKTPDDFTAWDRISIGWTCWLLANTYSGGDKIAECLRKGAEFGDGNCLEVIESPPIEISIREGTFSGLVLKIGNTGSAALLAHISVHNEDANTTDFEHDVMLPPNVETELGWVEMARNIEMGDTVLVSCQNYSFGKVCSVDPNNGFTVTSVNLNEISESGG